MKRIIITVALAAFGLSAIFAQNEFDAQRFAKNDILGTARYMGMAGAFNSLGGDPTSMSTNPAGLGLYRRSELTFTANLGINATKADYNDGSLSENKTNLNVNNFAYITSFRYYTGTQKESWGVFGVSFNRLANYHRNFSSGKQYVPIDQTLAALISDTSQGIYLIAFKGEVLDNFGRPISPWRNNDLGWLSVLGYESGLLYPLDTNPDNEDYSTGLDPEVDSADSQMTYSERGYVNEWAFTYSHNFDNKFYLGVTLGIEDLEYERSSLYEEYYFERDAENFFGSFQLDNWQLTTGTGFNFKVGGILRATENLRLALAFHSPTWYTMTSQYYGKAETYFNKDRDFTSAEDEYFGGAEPIEPHTKPYNYRSPYKILTGVSYLFGKKGIVSFDYEMTDYTSMGLHERDGSNGWFATDVNFKNLKAVHTVKLGAEFRVTDNFSIRAGLANVSRSTDKDVQYGLPLNDPRTDSEFFVDRGTQYVSLGWGYRTGSFFFDMAYMLRSNKSDLYTSGYDFIPQEIRTNSHNIVATVGLRF